MKYIVENSPNQNITGNLRIDGSLTVTDGTFSYGIYRALLTHAGIFSGTDISVFNDAFIVGETYTITNYLGYDDFSNIAYVISGDINTTGCQFIATGEIPKVWIYGSAVESSGNFVVRVLENTLGYDIEWSEFYSPGVYIGTKNSYPGGSLFNDFPRRDVSAIISQSSLMLYGPPPGPITQFAGPASFGAKDDVITVFNFSYDSYAGEPNWLYYTPIEIKVKQNIDTTPISISGNIVDTFPISYVSFDIFESGSPIEVETIYCVNTSSVNNITELVTLLNSDINSSYFGTYEDDGVGGVTLTMATNLKNQFSPNGTLTISIFND